jgi:hypothetical protein
MVLSHEQPIRRPAIPPLDLGMFLQEQRATSRQIQRALPVKARMPAHIIRQSVVERAGARSTQWTARSLPAILIPFSDLLLSIVPVMTRDNIDNQVVQGD